jgi:purine-binding chemotaxis protein CheW
MQETKLKTQISTASVDNPHFGLLNRQMDMVAFHIDKQIYTLPIEIIHQVIDMVAITPIPEKNDSIKGIFNFHGTTIPVVNLRNFLNLTEIPVQLHSPMILVSFSGQIIGLIVDKVIGVVSYPMEAILSPEDLLPADLGKIQILDGVIQSPEGFFMLLNLENLFALQSQQDLTETLDKLTAFQMVPEVQERTV